MTVLSETDEPMQRNIFRSGVTTLIISNKEIDDMMKIVKSLEESGLLIKGVIERVENEKNNKKVDFLRLLLCPLGASLLGNMLAGKGVIQVGEGTFRNDKF